MAKKKPFFKQTNFILVVALLLFFVLVLVGSFIVLRYTVFGFPYEVVLRPESEVSAEELDLTAEIISKRLNTYGFSNKAEVKSGLIFLRGSGKVAEDEAALEDLLQSNEFEAKIGEKVLFEGGDDVVKVCGTAECSGFDPRRPCNLINGEWVCSYFFSVILLQFLIIYWKNPNNTHNHNVLH